MKILALFLTLSALQKSTTAAFTIHSSPPRLIVQRRRSIALNAQESIQDSIFASNIITAAEAGASSLKGQIVVVKYGGNAMTSSELSQGFCENVAALQNLY